MEKEVKTIGLSRDLIIHPGETLIEVLEDREMSQKELAIRTGMTEKHISTVVHGQKNISPSFARKLEYALGIETEFWMNLQANYERELLEFEDLNNISEKELSVLKNLKDVLTMWEDAGWIEKDANQAALVLDVRKIFGISNLLDTPKMKYAAAFRAQSKNVNIDPYVLFAWQRMCEKLTENIEVAEEVNLDLLRDKIPEIKQVMFMKANQIQSKLTNIFSECGIAFRIVPNFKGAPVQGFIKTTEDGSLILCMTLRQKFADIFWFTLFHEIAHILNGDTKYDFVDFDSVSGESEAKADKMAGEFLINSKAYRKFVDNNEYGTVKGINEFAKQQSVKDYIVLGRLMKDKKIPWGSRLRYEWA
ncbi:MAG: HigA family addiction module antidote protein [Eubacterium sp.]|nr:HigA family addiction module antidote protein [Eubacterium sp.]